MKHLTKIFLLGTAVLAAAACQREPLMRTSGDDSEKQDVVVDLVLNVSTGRNASTKMTDANVQMSNNFLGIQNAVIIPFETGNTEADRYVTLNAGHTTGNQFYDLGLLFPSSQIPGGEGGTNADKSRRVVQLSIPLGTDAMLFYGKAYNPILPSADDDDIILNRRNRGALLDNISTTPTDPTDIKFDLVSRLTGKAAIDSDATTLDDYIQTAELMEYILNYIIYDAAVPSIASYKAPKDVTTYSDLDELEWRDLATDQNNHVQLKPLEDLLASAYNKIMTVNSNEYRGASSYAVSLIMEDLSEIIDAVVTAVPTGKEEANAIRLANEYIKPAIDKFFDHDNHHVFKQLSLLKGYVTETLSPTQTQTKEQVYQEKFGHAKEPSEFPYELFRIPEGAAQMGIDSEGKIEYKIPNRALLHPEEPVPPATVVNFPPYKYTYPAELAYFVNSPLLITTSKVEDSDDYFPNGYNKWYNQLYWNNLDMGWSQGFVGTETKGVAIRDNVNYGVALLETTVAYKSGVTSVNDNRGHFSPAEGDATISTSNLSLELFGVLIGNANVEVNWQYLSTSNNADDYSYVLYDDVMETESSANFVRNGHTVKNYTLVLDNYINQTNQLEVPIALEFINRGVDFWGRDNLIRKDATFYLLGKLNITDAGTTINWGITEDKLHEPGNDYIERYGYQIPPTYGVGSESAGSNVKGKSKKITRVFIQNFTTKANFKIGTETLQHAYVTLPDLRSSQMSLGLSVDLSWQPGLEFTVEL